jgi:ABC-type transport system involved in multi-copper enzyme maturation permease subunit
VSALLGVELRRILSRRAVWAAAAIVLLGMVIAGIVLFARSHRSTSAELQDQVRQVEVERRQAIAECAAGAFGIPAEEVPPGMTLEQYCEQVVGTGEINDAAFRLVRFREIAENLSGLFITLLMILSASFIGAEWHAGTITTQLTWEPRRNRVLAAKAVAAALVALVFFVLANIVLFGIVTPSALFRGSTDGLTLGWFQGAGGVVLRGAVAAALTSAIAFSLASLARNTAAAVGGVFVYIAIVEPLMRAARPRWQPWYLFDNLSTFISGHTPGFTPFGRTMTGAGVLLAVYTMGFILLAMAVFRRRDVT